MSAGEDFSRCPTLLWTADPLAPARCPLSWQMTEMTAGLCARGKQIRLQVLHGLLQPYMDVLPPYTSHEAIGGTSHTVAHDKGGLEVQFFSHAVTHTSPPIFHNESIISGTLHLEVHESLLSSIHGVTVTLRGFEREMRGAFGQATTMSKTAEIGQTTFLSVKQELYKHDNGKLVAGTHSWPFALAFPKTFRSVSKKALDEEFELPPTFSAPGYPTYLLYELRCEVSKSTLAGDEIMSVPIHYVPRKGAARPSKARMLAYETGSPAPSPLHDPEGWQTTTATTKVQVFKAREVDISVSFSLARPLEYARGTFIPFYMNVTCDDAQALDLLSTPQAFSIVLDRRLHASEPSGRRAVDERGNGQDTVSEGKYWRAEPNYEGHNTRAFEGEIVVGVQLMQNFTYPKLSLHHAVLVALQVDGITLLGENPIVSVPVEVVYLPAQGVKAVSHAPKTGDVAGQYIDNDAPLMMVDR